MADLRLGSVPFITSPERDRLAALRGKYMAVGLEYRAKFLASYSTFKTADALFEGFPDKLAEALSRTVGMAAGDITSNGVYDLDDAAIRSNLDERIDTVRSGFDKIQDQYFEILGKSAELDAQRTAARENRPGIIGGGFGVEGAAKGIAIATAANAAIGLAYGLVNLTSKAVSELGDAKKKRDLLEAPSTKTALADFLCRAVLQGYRLVADAVNAASDSTVFDVVTDDAQKRSSAMADNVSSGRVPAEEVKTVLIQALSLDPFNDKAWKLWLDQFGDQDGSVAASAKALDVQVVETHKAKLMDAKRKAMDWSTPERCRSNGSLLEQAAKRLGVDFAAERERIEKMADELYRKSCSYGGKVYPTPEAAKAAADADQARRDEIQSRTFDGTVYRTVGEASAARVAKRENDLLVSRANSGWGWATLAFKRKGVISGRSCRKEFWYLIGLYASSFFAFGSISLLIKNSVMYGDIISGIIAIPFAIHILFGCIFLLNVQIRRFHDMNKSGLFALLNIIPYVGWFIVLIMMMVPGTRGDNRYGPDPSRR